MARNASKNGSLCNPGKQPYPEGIPLTPYPSVLPIDDLKIIIDAIRTQKLQGETPLLAKSLWELVGFGLGQSLGEPGAPNGIQSCGPDCPCLTHDQVADYLADLASHHEKGVVGALPIPWAAIIKWALPLLLQLI
jgi:hypothetical protein